MIFRIHFKIGGQVWLNHSEVLPVTLAIHDQAGQIEELVSFLIPLPKSLESIFMQWQQYIGNYKTRKVVRNSGIFVSGVVNITELTSSLKVELNKWLDCDGWVDEYGQLDPRVNVVLRNFRQRITDRDEVQIIVQTEDLRLRQLPWQEWNMLAEYTDRGVEVAIAATNFRRLSQKQTPQINATVRILVVFGDETLGLEEEGNFLENLKLHGGELHVLQQPTRLELEQSLQDPQGWHIFFFAGHSESDANKRVGRFQINPADGDRGFVEIAELRGLLRGAIENKLQLAIFNSCDGLGLANQLTELSLPYCVVMREVVESEVARELLKNFLAAFVRNHSLFASMGIARRQLQLQFAAGKSWLPVIVANPLAPELTWNRLFSERRLSWQWEVVLGFVTLAVLLCLPIGILYEFQGLNSLILYAHFYPQIVVFPSLFFWVPLLAFYRAYCMIRVKTKPFIVCTLATFLITLGMLPFEITGDRIMLLNLKSEAEVIVDANKLPQLYSTWKTSENQLMSIPKNFFDIHHAFDIRGNLRLKKSELELAAVKLEESELGVKKINTPEHKVGIQGLLRIATSYQVWKKYPASFSTSRIFYILIFLVTFAVTLQNLALTITILMAPDSIMSKNKYLIYLIICEFGAVLWLPFQSYSVEYTKEMLFSEQFRGSVSGLNPIVIVMFLVELLVTTISVSKSATEKYKSILFSLILMICGLRILISLFGASIINQLFGMNSTNLLIPWLSFIVFFAPIFFSLTFWIDRYVKDE
jgi:CHAT domain